MRLLHYAFVGLSLLVGCRSDGNPQSDDQPPIDGPPTGGVVKVKDIQSDAMPIGTPVQLKDVVVTAIDKYGMRTGDFWVQDAEGGQFSGVHVFGAPLEVVGMLKPGDVVDIAGAEKDEFALTSDTSGNTVTELAPVMGGTMLVTKKSDGPMPTPALVDALAIGQKATFQERNAEWEKWEGVLIKVDNVSAVSEVDCVGRACTDPTLEKFDVTGDVVVESALAKFPEGIVRDACLASATGVLDYFFDYLIYNRTTEEVATGGTACPAKETTVETCGDDIDNDGNGFMDCNDRNCQLTVDSCSTATTVVAIQMGTVMDAVRLTDVFVTGRAPSGVWVADRLAAGQHNGVFVFTGSTAPPANLVVGAKVNVRGIVTEFDVAPMGMTAMGDKLTEITSSQITFVAAPAGVPTPATTANAATLSDIGAPGEPWEGVLVRLSNMKVTNADAGQGKVELTANDGGKIIMDNDSYSWPAPTVNTCYATLTGLMSVQLTDNLRTINPRSAADMVVGAAGCN